MAVALVISVVWLAGTGALLLTLGSDGAQWLAIAVAVALPLLVIWFAALLARQSAVLYEAAEKLAQSAEEVRKAAAAAPDRADAPRPGPPPSAEPARQPAQQQPMRLTRAAEQAPPPPPHPRRPAGRTPADRNRQEALPLGMAAEESPVSMATLVRALDFPASPEDKEGFRALHRALRDPRARRLVQASQDVLTLLGEEGIYMDDLSPSRARPELWRRFAGGERGAEVGAIGGIRDRSSLALTAAKLRGDPVFRDAAHHFLRLFDMALTEIAEEATDAQLAALTDTRTSRAFMLVGRVAGIFE